MEIPFGQLERLDQVITIVRKYSRIESNAVSYNKNDIEHTNIDQKIKVTLEETTYVYQYYNK